MQVRTLGRTGNKCKDTQDLNTGVCSNITTCCDVHIWEKDKFGDIAEAIEKNCRPPTASGGKGRLTATGAAPSHAPVMMMIDESTTESDTQMDCDREHTHVSLGDGMGGAVIAMERAGIKWTTYIAYEVLGVAKHVAAHTTPGMQHAVDGDVMHITEETVIGWEQVDSMSISMLCADVSNLRNFVNGKWQPKSDKRPGLNGPSGRTFRHALQVLKWALKHNPDMEFLVESVDFSTLKPDWLEV